MKVSDYITQLFVEYNIKHVFSISGAGNVHLLNSILENPDLISIHPHQEQSETHFFGKNLFVFPYYRHLIIKVGTLLFG